MDLTSLKALLPGAWQGLESFADERRVGKLTLRLAGFMLTRQSGESVTGSAASFDDDPSSRALWELLERVCIVEAQHGKQPIKLKTRQGKVVKSILPGEVFPASPAPEIWTYAKSNGVAIEKNWGIATQKAFFELAERDAVLRSWFGETPPVPGADDSQLPAALAGDYDLRVYKFPGMSREKAVVFGYFGLPQAVERPLFFGFGCGENEVSAKAKAVNEAVQRLGFLWDEEIPSQQPVLEPTPLFHQEFFLYPANHHLLTQWLAGKQRQNYLKPLPAVNGENVLFVDLTPHFAGNDFVLVKALAPGALPLTFGSCREFLEDTCPHSLEVHPIA